MKELEELAKLLSKRNKVDSRISDIIMRPAITGHIGEYIASKLFDIKLEKSAPVESYDGKFSSGGLIGKTVNIKYYPKKENILDLKPAGSNQPDYYLVLTGPQSKAVSSRGTTRPLLIEYVFLFDSLDLLQRLKERGVKIGIATSVISELWKLAEIYPKNINSSINLKDSKLKALRHFGNYTTPNSQKV